MKITMVIPSYWARESAIGWKEGDAIYDHPTSLNSEGTLSRAIESIKILRDKDFKLVIIAAATAEEIQAEIENKVGSIIRSASANIDVKTLLFGPSHLQKLHRILIDAGKGEYADLLKLRGYSNIRNLCIFIPHILNSDVALLIDDDEVFEDPEFMLKVREFIGKNIAQKDVYAVAGCYLQPDGGYHLKKPYYPWMQYWDQSARMNEAFDKIILTKPRLKETPFVFGGNMIIHRNLFTVVPFDPSVPRGEDIDFLINAKMFGYTFFLDNQLSIKHLPPPKTHPTWIQMREDIYRFIYERAKIQHQKEKRGMTRVYPEEFEPYPGAFLKNDLEEKIEESCKLLSKEYLSNGNIKDSEEALKNIEIAKTDANPKANPFENLCKLQKRWREFMAYTDKPDIKLSLREIVEENKY